MEAKRRERLAERSLRLRREGAKRRDDQDAAADRQGHQRRNLRHARLAGAGRQRDDEIVGQIAGAFCRLALRRPKLDFGILAGIERGNKHVTKDGIGFRATFRRVEW